MADIITRVASKKDAKKIYELMQQHVAEQNTVLPPHLTIDAVEENAWGPQAGFMAFVAEHKEAKDGVLQGYIIAHHVISNWKLALYIREVYVVPAMRRCGVAVKLCTSLLKAAVGMGCKMCDVKINKANKAAVDLFVKLGAKNITEIKDYSIFSLDRKGMAGMKAMCEVPEQFKVRPGGPEDMAGVTSMIRELAVHLKDYSSVDVESLMANSPPHDTFVEYYVAEHDGTLVGYVLYYNRLFCQDGDIFMEDLYIKPSYRSKGLGKILMAHVAERGHARGANSLDFVCVSWNTKSVAFYEHLGAINITTSKGSHLYRLDFPAMNKCIQDQ